MSFVGSKLPIIKGQLQESIRTLQNKLEEKREAEDYQGLEDFHNLFVTYTLLLLQAGTGHRPVRDPFCFGQDFELGAGFVLINDKISSDAHRCRLAWLSEIQIKQVLNYQAHLYSIGSKILAGHYPHKINKLVGEAIIDTALTLDPACRQDREQNVVPLFFFLKDGAFIQIGRSVIKTQIGDIWPYPLNQHRHILKSELVVRGVPPWLVGAHLGHIPTNQHEFGGYSIASPNKLGLLLSSHLNELLVDYGWLSVDGIKKSPRTQPKRIRARLERPWEFSPEARERKRQKKRDLALKRLRSTLSPLKNKIKKEGIAANENEISDLNRMVIEEIGDDPNFAQKYLAEFFQENVVPSKNKGQIVKIQWIVGVGASPFLDPWLSSYKEARQLKTRLAEYFDRRGREKAKPTIYESWAELIVCAPLCGGLLNPAYLHQMIDEKRPEFRRTGSLVFVEFTREIEVEIKSKIEIRTLLDWRWIPDPVSLSLLHRMGDLYQDKIDLVKLNNVLDQLGTSLQINLGKSLKSKISKLCNLGSAGLKLELPGYIHQVAKRTNKSFVLDAETMIRLQSQKPVKKVVENKVIDKVTDISFVKTHIIARNAKTKRINNVGFNKLLRKAFNAVRSPERDIKEAAAKVRNQSKQIQLANKLKLLLPQAYSDLAILATGWGIHMCEVGTVKLDEASLNTIDKYLFTVFNALDTVLGEESLLDSSGYELEALYIDAVKHSKAEKRKDVIDRLYNFHNYIRHFYDVDDVEWGSIYAAFNHPKFNNVSANIVTYSEYEHALWLARQAEESNKTLYGIVGAAIVIGYRFGLRLGEVSRLRIGDLQLGSNGKIFVQVQNTIEGDVKSKAGVRSVPLVGCRLTKEEQYFIDSLVSRWSDHPRKTPFTPILNLVENINSKAVSGFELSDAVNSILKHATRNNEICFHTLRHSWMCRIFMGSYGRLSSHETLLTLQQKMFGAIYPQSVDGHLFDIHGVDRVSFPIALANMIGHRTFETTVTSYIHVCDWVIADHVNGIDYPEMTRPAAAYIRGVKPASITHALMLMDKDRSDESNSNRNYNPLSAYAALSSYKIAANAKSVDVTTDDFLKTYSRGSSDKDDINSLTLFKIFKVLLNYARSGRNLLDLDSKSNLDANLIIEIVKSAKEIERRSRYIRFALRDSDDIILTDNSYKFDESIEYGVDGFFELVHRVDKIISGLTSDDLKLAYRGCDEWSRGHKQSGDEHFILFDSADQLTDFSKLLTIFGLLPKNIELRYPAKFDQITKEKLMRRWTGHYDYDFRQSTRTRTFMTRLHNGEPCVSLHLKSKNDVSHSGWDNRKLNLIIFVLFVKLSLLPINQ